MSKNVYLLTDGEYSDYHIVGVFSTEAAAEAYKGAMKLDGAGVEIMPVDPRQDQINAGLSPFWLSLWIDGRSDVESIDDRYEWMREDRGLKMDFNWGKRRVRGCVWAKDKQHAAKIASEFKARSIAGMPPEEAALWTAQHEG